MALTTSQTKKLRAMAHHLNPVVLVGKSNVTDLLAQQASQALEAHELIKCAVQDGSDLTAREAADELAERVDAQVIQVIGHRFSLYRRSNKPGIEHIEV